MFLQVGIGNSLNDAEFTIKKDEDILVHIKGKSRTRCRENPVGCPSAFLCQRQAKTPHPATLTLSS